MTTDQNLADETWNAILASGQVRYLDEPELLLLIANTYSRIHEVNYKRGIVNDMAFELCKKLPADSEMKNYNRRANTLSEMMEETSKHISTVVELLQMKKVRLEDHISEELYEKGKWKRLKSLGFKREERKFAINKSTGEVRDVQYRDVD